MYTEEHFDLTYLIIFRYLNLSKYQERFNFEYFDE